MTDQNLNEELMDKLTKVCLCKGISRKTIKAAIKNGATSVAEVNKATGSGSGPCHGQRCSPKIQALLEQEHE